MNTITVIPIVKGKTLDEITPSDDYGYYATITESDGDTSLLWPLDEKTGNTDCGCIDASYFDENIYSMDSIIEKIAELEIPIITDFSYDIANTSFTITRSDNTTFESKLELSKDHIGLGNVDNTSDELKNVLTATKLILARTIQLSGDVSGSVSFDGSSNVTIDTSFSGNNYLEILSSINQILTSIQIMTEDIDDAYVMSLAGI